MLTPYTLIAWFDEDGEIIFQVLVPGKADIDGMIFSNVLAYAIHIDSASVDDINAGHETLAKVHALDIKNGITKK
jgi:hypothetical protein